MDIKEHYRQSATISYTMRTRKTRSAVNLTVPGSVRDIKDKQFIFYMKILSLISAGIDSPVATWMMQHRGCEVVCVHFATLDKTSEDKTKKIVKFLGVKKIYLVKHKKIVTDDLIRNCKNQARCVLCKRMMVRVAEKIALREGCDFLLTGDNIGQVASQTLDNMAVITKAVDMMILRPLLCNDKQETMDLAKKIGTYDLSISAPICCTAVPKMPMTKTKLEMIEREEKRIDVKSIVASAVESAEVLEL